MVNDVLAETWFRMSESTPDKKLAEVYLQNALRLSPELVQKIRCVRVREELPEQVNNRDYDAASSSLEFLEEVSDGISPRHILHQST